MLDLRTSTNLMHLFGDPTRVRLMALLEHEELAVAEIVQVTGLTQSRVSTHLGKLREAGLLRDRREGASTFYRVRESLPVAGRLWQALRAEVQDATLEADRRRADALVRARAGDAAWPDTVAGQMERHYSPGRTWEAYARAFVGLARLGDVLDVGSGDGAIAALLAPRARSVTCVDRSRRVLAAARRRLAGRAAAHFVRADAGRLPFPDRRFDQVLLLNVLNYAPDPAPLLAEAARVLRDGGGLVATALAPHDHAETTEPYGHRDRGLDPRALRAALEAAGLRVDTCEVTSRERRAPHFEVVHLFATRPHAAKADPTTDETDER